jgi:uncharacterized protein
MLQIHIGNITEKGLDLKENVEATALPLLNMICNETSLHFAETIQVHIHTSIVKATVLIVGSAKTKIHVPCSRCLMRFDLDIETAFSTTAVPEWPNTELTDAMDDVELSVDDIDVIGYDGDRLDLREEIAQQIIMSLPAKPVCRPSCKGLCSHCGIDLNQSGCHCSTADDNNPFRALKIRSFPEKKE